MTGDLFDAVNRALDAVTEGNDAKALHILTQARDIALEHITECSVRCPSCHALLEVWEQPDPRRVTLPVLKLVP